jgi:hypothetical protein
MLCRVQRQREGQGGGEGRKAAHSCSKHELLQCLLRKLLRMAVPD